MFARTARLLLRPGWSEDAPALFQAICDARIVRNLAQAPRPYSMDHALAFLPRARAPRDAGLSLSRRPASAPRLVGGIGVHLLPSGQDELGYWIARPFWGRGIATEAGEAVIAN